MVILITRAREVGTIGTLLYDQVHGTRALSPQIPLPDRGARPTRARTYDYGQNSASSCHGNNNKN